MQGWHPKTWAGAARGATTAGGHGCYWNCVVAEEVVDG